MKTELNMAEVLYNHFHPECGDTMANLLVQCNATLYFENIRLLQYPELLPEARINEDFGRIVVLVESPN